MPNTKCRDRLPWSEAEVAQARYEQAEAELAAVGSDLQDQVEYTITLRERAEQAEAENERHKWMLDRLSHQHWPYNEDGNEARRVAHLMALRSEYNARCESASDTGGEG